MEEVNNLDQDGVLEVIKDFPVQPLKNRVIITVNADEKDEGLKLSESAFSDTQFIVATGSFVNEVEPGQKVLLDLEKMMVFNTSAEDAYSKVGSIKIDPIKVDDRMYAIIYDTYIKAKDNR